MRGIVDTKKLWVEGGYSQDNKFEVSMARVYRHGEEQGVPKENVDLILAGFFLELRKDPTRYITEDRSCICGCGIGNSGTNAIHTLFKRIDYKAKELAEIRGRMLTDEINQMVGEYIAKQDEEYIRENMAPEPVPTTWAQRNLPTFRKWVGMK